MALRQENRWAARPRTALMLKMAIYVVPLAASAATAYLTRSWIDSEFPDAPTILALTGPLALASVTLVVGERVLRRLLPLVLLLRLSLLFPDQVPSRLGIALKAASPKRLARLAESPDQAEAHWAEQTLTLVAALHAHDRRTRGHSERVRALTMLVGDEIRIEGEDRDKLEWAALLHDIGKLTVPSEILNKRGRPDEDEWAILQGHPAAGAVLAAELQEWLGRWLHAIDQHHERFDGTGYPARLGREQIELSGRIVAVTDAFETMTATRSYKKPLSVQSARSELVDCSETHFDPAVVRAFMNVSLGNLHRALGPLSWLTSLPFAGGVNHGVRLGGAIVGGVPAPVLTAAAVVMLASPAAGVIATGSGSPNRAEAADPSLSTTEIVEPADDPIVARPDLTPETEIDVTIGSAGRDGRSSPDGDHGGDTDDPHTDATGGDGVDSEPGAAETEPDEYSGPRADDDGDGPAGDVVGTITGVVGELEPTVDQVSETVTRLTQDAEELVSSIVEEPLSVDGAVEGTIDDVAGHVEDLTGTVGELLGSPDEGDVDDGDADETDGDDLDDEHPLAELGELTAGLLGPG